MAPRELGAHALRETISRTPRVSSPTRIGTAYAVARPAFSSCSLRAASVSCAKPRAKTGSPRAQAVPGSPSLGRISSPEQSSRKSCPSEGATWLARPWISYASSSTSQARPTSKPRCWQSAEGALRYRRAREARVGDRDADGKPHPRPRDFLVERSGRGHASDESTLEPGSLAHDQRRVEERGTIDPWRFFQERIEEARRRR